MPNIHVDLITDLAENILCVNDFKSKFEVDEFMMILRNYVYHLYADEDNDIVDPNDSDYTDDSD